MTDTLIEACVSAGTTQPVTVHEAWLAVMAEVRAVGKDGKYTSKTANYSFRGIDGVVNAVGPALRLHRVHVRPIAIVAEYQQVEAGANRTLMRECTATVTYRVTGPNGDYFDGQAQGEALDSSDKGSAKAQSVAYRVFLLQSLTIPTDEPDPDEFRHERASAPEPAPPVPGFRSSLMAAVEGLNEAEREVLRAWLVEQGLPDRPSKMDAEQSDRVCDFIMHGLPMVEPEGADQ